MLPAAAILEANWATTFLVNATHELLPLLRILIIE